MRALLLTITSFILASSLSFGLKVTWTDVVYDNNGNVTELLDGETGDIIGSYKYDPYGNTIDIQGEAAYENKVRFSTKEVDSSGLYYYGYRYYNPKDGRWLNRDPIEERGGMNIYCFVGNSSINVYDVLGLSTCNGSNDKGNTKTEYHDIPGAQHTNCTSSDDTVNLSGSGSASAYGVSISFEASLSVTVSACKKVKVKAEVEYICKQTGWFSWLSSSWNFVPNSFKGTKSDESNASC